MFRYFSLRGMGSDALHLKVGLAILFVNDLVAVGSQIGGVYLYTITHWGDVSYLSHEMFMQPTYLITTGVTQVLAQAFLIERVHKLSQSWIPVPFLALPTLAGCAGAFWAAAVVVLHQSNADRYLFKTPVTVWLIASAVADVSIALSLFAILYRKRQLVKLFESSRLDAPLKKLMTTTIESGSISTVLAVATLIVFLHNANSNAVAGIAFLLARVYALTVLWLLLNRPSLSNTGSASDPIMGSADGVLLKRVRTSHYPTGINVGGSGVRVHHSATVVVEDGTDQLQAQSIELSRYGRANGSAKTPFQDEIPIDSKMYMVPIDSRDRV